MKKLTAGEILYGPPSDEADLRHATPFLAPDPFALLRIGGRRILLVNRMEEQRARRTAKNAQVWSPGELGYEEGASAPVAQMILRAAKKLKIRAWRVSRSFPLHLAEQLREGGLRVSVMEDDPRQRRSVKTDEEIRRIRQTQQAAAGAVRRARAVLSEANILEDGRLFWNGAALTSERLRAEIEIFLLRKNCVCEATIVAGGAQGADPHERGTGPLRSGEFIVLDIFPRDRASGYWGDITRTVLKGRATATQRRRFAAVCRAQRVALSMIRPGASCARIHAAVMASLEKDGFPFRRVRGRAEGMIHGTGHGVGLEIHEHPRLANTKDALRKGHVVTVEPGLYSRADGGVRMEDTVVVTAGGYRKLATATTALEIA